MFDLHDANLDPGATCFVCGQLASTVEHVIPRWLQNRFDLWNQRLSLPNGTDIAYRQLVIPACAKCNSDVFGALEKRVENGTATESDVWKWANKIHYGLGHKHRFLQWDRQHPGYSIGDILKQDDILERDRHFLHSVAGAFRTDPDPFGTVYRFDFDGPQRFVFAHLMSSNSICVSLGLVGYVVFVLDGQALKRDMATSDLFARSSKARVEDMLFFFAQCVEHLARHKLGQNIIMTKGSIARVGKTVVHGVEPLNKVRFRAICRALGLEWVDTDPDTGNSVCIHDFLP